MVHSSSSDDVATYDLLRAGELPILWPDENGSGKTKHPDRIAVGNHSLRVPASIVSGDGVGESLEFATKSLPLVSVTSRTVSAESVVGLLGSEYIETVSASASSGEFVLRGKVNGGRGW